MLRLAPLVLLAGCSVIDDRLSSESCGLTEARIERYEACLMAPQCSLEPVETVDYLREVSAQPEACYREHEALRVRVDIRDGRAVAGLRYRF